MSDFRAGVAASSLAPPLGLPMPGFVRSQDGATGYGLPLEATALVLERDATRIVLCGVDTLGIQSPAVDRIRQRVAEATGAVPAGVLLNWNHTHRAPPATRDFLRRSGSLGDWTGTRGSMTTPRSSSGRSSPLRRSPPLSSSLRGSPGASARSTSRSTGATSGRRGRSSTAGAGAASSTAMSFAASAPPGRQRHRHARRVRLPHRVGGMDVPLYSSDFPAPCAWRYAR